MVIDIGTAVFTAFACILVYFLGPLCKILFNYLIAVHFCSMRKRLKEAGDWAIITGSSEGIGKSYARFLAREGLNVYLMGKDAPELENVAAEIRRDFGVETKTFVCDFFHLDIYDSIAKDINQLGSIACLVNNVGIAYSRFAAFSDANFITLEFIRNIVNCNITSMVSLTRIVLPKMLKQTTGKTCAIINLSSFSATLPFPYLTLYGATKACILNFSQALSREIDSHRVHIQVVCPMLIATRMTGLPPVSYFIPTPDTFVNSALDMLGIESVTVGHFGQALRSYVMYIVPGLAIRLAKYRHTQGLPSKKD